MRSAGATPARSAGGRAGSAGVAALPAHEVGDASRVLAAAFRDNPLNVAVIGGGPRRRLRCNRAGMRQLLPVARRHGLVLRAGAGPVAGVLVATPPRAYPLPPPTLGSRLRALAAQGPGVQLRWGRVFDHLQRIHPQEPHWYLATLGVAPDHRSRGIGHALLGALLDQADREGAPCYLETDRAENVAFYGPAGFAVCRESAVLGVRIWHMRRAPPSA